MHHQLEEKQYYPVWILCSNDLTYTRVHVNKVPVGLYKDSRYTFVCLCIPTGASTSEYLTSWPNANTRNSRRADTNNPWIALTSRRHQGCHIIKARSKCDHWKWDWSHIITLNNMKWSTESIASWTMQCSGGYGMWVLVIIWDMDFQYEVVR